MIDIETRKKIYELAKNPNKTYQQIADELRISASAVHANIYNLAKKGHESYNINLYNEIMFKRNAFSGIEDKDIIKTITNLVFNGFLYVEIAVILGKTEREIRAEIEKNNNPSYLFYDPELYEKIVSQNKKNEAQKEEKIYQRLRKLESDGVKLGDISGYPLVKKYISRKGLCQIIEEYLNANMEISDQALATKLNYSLTTIRECLRGNLERDYLETVFGKETMAKIDAKRAELNEEVKERRKKEFSDKKKDKPHSDTIPEIENSLEFWIKMICTFRLSFKSFARLVNCQDTIALHNTLFQGAKNINYYYINALNFVFDTVDSSKQEENYQKAKKYLVLLGLAKRQGNEEYRKMLRELNDYEYIKLIKRKDDYPDEKLTEQEIRIIHEFRLKYALHYSQLPFDRKDLYRRCPSDLQSEVEALSVYNAERSRLIKSADWKKGGNPAGGPKR